MAGNASTAAGLARGNADDAWAVVDPAQPDSLTQRANASLAKSAELNRRVDDTLDVLVADEQNARARAGLTRAQALADWADRNISSIKGFGEDGLTKI
jgi:F420-0:gamma-glutamyl ligase